MFPTSANAQAQGGSCTTGYTAAADATGNNLICVSSVWQYTPYQFGASSALCNSSSQGGIVQWTGSALQFCNGSSWTTITGSASTQYQMAYYAATGTTISNDSALTTDANNVLNIAGTTVTTSDPALNVTQTWNASGVTFTGIVETITNTASAAASLLLNLVVGSTSEFKVDESGNVTAKGYVNAVSVNTGYELNGIAAIRFPTSDSGTAGSSIAMGKGALNTQTTSAAYSNTAIAPGCPYGSPSITTAAIDNVILGGCTAESLTSGYDNTMLGSGGGFNITSGYGNVTIIAAAGGPSGGTLCCSVNIAPFTFDNDTGSYNTAVGYDAEGTVSSGQYSVGIGIYVLGSGATNVTGSYNTGIGAFSLQVAQGASANNTAIGEFAGGALTTGATNTFIGVNVGTTTLTTGSNNILVGTSSAVTTAAAATSNFVSIGNLYEGDTSIDHVVYHGTAPALTKTAASCGTAASIVGNDDVGVITLGTTIGTTCTLTFHSAWTTAPVCMVQDTLTANILHGVVGTTTLVITGGAASDKINYYCSGYQR